MNIGNIELKNGLILAPMAGVTDLPFRLICKEMGCDYVVTEMVSAKAILYNNKNTKPLLASVEREHPVAVQLFGSNPEIMGDMAKKLDEERAFDAIDINMGCPVPKIVNNGEGSALMKNPKLVEEILTNIVSKVKVPVTVKFRKGFNDEMVNAPEIAKIAESCGVSAVAVHGRTREQYYAGEADWDIIRQVKDAVGIPVIGNGDVRDVDSAIQMYEQTGCDGIMVGRAVRGNPWLFRELKEYFEHGRRIEKPSKEEIIDMILRQCEMSIQEKGEFTGIREMRKHVAWYTAGMPHSSSIRASVNMVESYEELVQLMKKL